ncbi:hypothetical protein GUA87_00150 [Sneathiella sp. P13V-1]|uniref:HNH endonuclease n=1 Tax=Sneathiella sp. P13V-1 TaxID=2697366 RepID=UPI00187BAF4D|nr:HNH endonuclease [Sneathiella sp. P13V-1]MBE7635239.1 hypothetical protein [Sneathiella sp. P13V-1]
MQINTDYLLKLYGENGGTPIINLCKSTVVSYGELSKDGKLNPNKPRGKAFLDGMKYVLENYSSQKNTIPVVFFDRSGNKWKFDKSYVASLVSKKFLMKPDSKGFDEEAVEYEVGSKLLELLGVSENTWESAFDNWKGPSGKELQRKLRSQKSRPKQDRFRKTQLKIWGNKCAVTEESVLAAIEAAHVFPEGMDNENVTYDPANGICLRSDLHKLLDKGLVGFLSEGNSLRIVVSKDLEHSSYATLRGRLFPKGEYKKRRVPHDKALDWMGEELGWKNADQSWFY